MSTAYCVYVGTPAGPELQQRGGFVAALNELRRILRDRPTAPVEIVNEDHCDYSWEGDRWEGTDGLTEREREMVEAVMAQEIPNSCRDCGGPLSASCKCVNPNLRLITSEPKTDLEKFEKHFGPMCSCGSRNTVRVGYSADPTQDEGGSTSKRRCNNCGRVSSFRVHDGHYVPFTPETAVALDETRQHPQGGVR